nr:hypothetical protein BaRGS_029180 [Batillaria attramentaria]
MGEDGGLRKGGGWRRVFRATIRTSHNTYNSDVTILFVAIFRPHGVVVHAESAVIAFTKHEADWHDEYHQTSLKTLANALDKEETTSESKPCNCESGSDEHDPDPDSSMPSVPSLSRSSRHLTSVRKLQEVDCEKDEGVLGKTSEKDADQLQERGSAVFFPKTLLIHEPNEDLSEENSKDSVQEKHSFVCCMSDKHDKTVLLSSERETAYDQDENSKDYAQEKHILSPCDMSEKDEKVAVPIPVLISGTEDTKSFSDSHQEEPIGKLDNKLTEEQVKGTDRLVEQIMKMTKAHFTLLMKKASAEDTAEEGTEKFGEKMGALFEANEDNLEKTVREVIARMYEMPKLDANLGKNSEAQPVDKPVTTTEEDSDTTSSSKMKRGAIEKKHVALQTLHNLISSNSLNNPALICLYAQYTQENNVGHVPYKHCNEFRNINVPGSSIYLGDHDSFLKLGIKMDDDSTLQNHLGSEPSDAEAAQHMGELPAWFPQSSRIPVENSYHDFQSTQFWLQRTWSKESTRSYAESLEAAKADGKSMIILDSLKHTKNQGQNDDGQMPTIEDEILKNPDAMLSEDDAVEKADLEDSEKSAPVPSEKIATGAPAEELETVPLPPPAPACHREHPRRRRSKKSEQQRSSRKKQRKGSVDCPAVVIVPADQASKSSEPPAPETAVTGMNNPDADDDDFSMNNPCCKGLAVMGPAMDDAETDRHEGKVTEEKEKAEKGVQSAFASTRDADDAPDTADACKKGSVHTADNRNAHSSHSQQQAGTTEAEVMYGCHDHEPASGKNAAAAAASFPQVASDREPSTQHKVCPSAVVPMSVRPPQTNPEMTCDKRKHQASKSHERREEKVCMERHMKTGQPRLVMNRRGHLGAPSDFEWGGERVDLRSVAVVFRTASGTSGGGNAGSGQQRGSSFSGRQSGSQGWGGARPKNGGSGGSRDDGDDDGDDKRERRPTKHAADEPEGPPPIDAKRKGQATPPARNYKRHRKKQHGTITNEQMCHCLGQAGLGIQMLQQSSGAGELDRCVMLCLHDTGNVMSPQDDDLLCCSCAMLHTLLSHFASAAHDSSCHLCLQLFTLVHFHMLQCRANGRGTEDQDVSVNVCHKMLMAGLFEDTSAAASSGKVWVKVRKYLSAALGPILLVESHVGEVEDTETEEWEEEEEEQGEEKVEETFNSHGSYHTYGVSDSVMNGISSGILQDIQRPESLPLPSPTFTSFASTSEDKRPAQGRLPHYPDDRYETQKTYGVRDGAILSMPEPRGARYLERTVSPNVVCFFGAIRHGEKIYMLAEFIDGGSLAALIKEQWLIGRRLSHWMALNYFRQILETLTYLQSKGILHEDIKADNLLLRQGTTEIILADFGVAQRICHDHAPRGKSPTGAPAHWSPEKASSEGHGFPSDLWAAACVLIHMLSGNPPWVSRFPDAGMLNFIIWSRPAPVDDIPENVKESMRDLITCCLVKDSAIRPTAKQILQHPAFQLLTALRLSFQSAPEELDYHHYPDLSLEDFQVIAKRTGLSMIPEDKEGESSGNSLLGSSVGSDDIHAWQYYQDQLGGESEEELGETDAPDEEVTSMLSVLQDGIPEQLEGHRLEFYNHEGKQLFDMRVRPRNNSWKELVRSFRSKIRKEGYRHFTLMHSDSETPVNWSAPIEPSLTKVKYIRQIELFLVLNNAFGHGGMVVTTVTFFDGSVVTGMVWLVTAVVTFSGDVVTLAWAVLPRCTA